MWGLYIKLLCSETCNQPNMAVSLTQLLQDANRRSRGLSMGQYTNIASFAPGIHNQPMLLPVPDAQPEHHDIQYISPPPLPPRSPNLPTQAMCTPGIEHQHSVSSATSSIQPDPLPPHSNPQALTQMQSNAYQNSSPIPPVRLGRDAILDAQTGYVMFVMNREAAHMPSFLSSKPILSCTRSSNGTLMGQVRFHTLTSSSIDLTVNGRGTSISHSGFIHNRWGFQSTTCVNKEEIWYWKKDKETGGARLEDSKKNGHLLAKMKGDLLTFEKGRLGQASYEEVLLSAIAMAEAARRQKKNADIADLASAIGAFASSDGGGGSGSDGGGGGGGGA